MSARRPPRSHIQLRRAFTLVEATVSLAIMSIAGTAILLTVTTSIDDTDEHWRRGVADFMAQALIDEISGQRYMERGANPFDTFLGPGSDEKIGPGRSRYDDIDDYNGLRIQPAADRWNVPLGLDYNNLQPRHASLQLSATAMSRWRQEVDIYYVDPNNLSRKLTGGQTSPYRCAEVRILYSHPQRGWETLAALKRVFAYVPEP